MSAAAAQAYDPAGSSLAAGLAHAATTSNSAVLLVGAGEPSRIVWINLAAAELLTQDGSSVVGLPLSTVLTWSTALPLLHTLRAQRRLGHMHSADGTAHPVMLTAHPVPGHQLWTVSASLEQDGAPRQHGLDEGFEHRVVALTERIPVPTVLSDVGMRLAHVNDAFAALVGVPADALLGCRWLDHIHPDDLGAVTACAERTLQGEASDTFARVQPGIGEQRWVHLRLAPAHTPGHGPGFVGTAEDVTERRELEQQLTYQAGHDALTGLPNRAALYDHLTRGLATRDATGAHVDPELAVLFLDLDNFKVINDSLGHDAGDAVLVDIAFRLQSAVRDQDVVTRMGGDEFVVVCHRVRDDAEAELLAARVLEVCTQPLTVSSIVVHPSASMGVARAGAAHTSAQDLLRDADIAMYEAKAQGKNQYSLCNDRIRDTARDTLLLIADLRRAIDERRLTVAYQPVIDLDAVQDDRGDEPLPAVEALARWDHPTRGPVPPDVFVPLAEAHRLIDPLTELVLDASCAQLARWREELGPLAPLRVNVNVSARQLCDLRLVRMVEDALRRHDLPATALCLEVTESALMVDPAASRQALLNLRALGVTVAVDDFGVGFSSLAQLHRLPVDHLKIDRSFVADLVTGEGGALAAAVVSLAGALGLSAIAEGVEDPGQAVMLQSLGCTLAQGWHWAPALPGDDLRDWVLRRAGRPEPVTPPRQRDALAVEPAR